MRRLETIAMRVHNQQSNAVGYHKITSWNLD